MKRTALAPGLLALLWIESSGSAAIWLLYNLDRPSNVVSFIAMLALGAVLGALWQRRHEKKLLAR